GELRDVEDGVDEEVAVDRHRRRLPYPLVLEGRLAGGQPAEGVHRVRGVEDEVALVDRNAGLLLLEGNDVFRLCQRVRIRPENMEVAGLELPQARRVLGDDR